MDLNDVISYTYTRNEIRRILLYSNFALISIPPMLLGFIPTVISLVNTGKASTIIIGIGIIILFILSIIYCLVELPKTIYNLNAEQKIYFVDNVFYYQSGKGLFKIDKKFLSKVIQTKHFYVINIAVTKFDLEWGEFFMLPYIPRRVISKEEMQRLAHELNIKFKER